MSNKQFVVCQYCGKRLRTYRQKKNGFCSTDHSLNALHTKLDIIMQKLEAEEHALDHMSFTINPDLQFDEYLKTLKLTDLPEE